MSLLASNPPRTIRIKLLGKHKPGFDGDGWFERFPHGKPVWGNCEFIFDRDCRDYDWLVVNEDMPSRAGERFTLWEEELACPRQHTLLTTTEPSTIKVYGHKFLSQFGWILTSQEPWVIRHPGHIYRQPGLVWLYAHRQPRGRYEAIAGHVPLAKTQDISAVCSNKRHRHTLHRRRYEFITGLKARVPELELFGHGIRPIETKADALDSFKYHVALENFYGLHHWTEKLSDPFVGACMPVYYGCPNAEDYFPSESFLRIDLRDLDGAVETIRRAMKDRLYEKNLGAILESRRLVLEQYNSIAEICRVINAHDDPQAPLPAPGETIRSRHLIRHRSIVNGLGFAAERAYVSTRHFLTTPR